MGVGRREEGGEVEGGWYVFFFSFFSFRFGGFGIADERKELLTYSQHSYPPPPSSSPQAYRVQSSPSPL